VRVILTVSPVPLVATYENRHVMVSTTYSKSAIRAALDDVARKYEFVDYFPSYEIITNWYNKGRYFEKDLRTVTLDGVEHVMRLFGAHYLRSHAQARVPISDVRAIREEIARGARIICDEQLLDAP
jgi:GSCFA family